MTDETTNERMGATCQALCERGYASLHVQDVAGESTERTGTFDPGAVAESVVNGAPTRHLAVNHPLENTRGTLFGGVQQRVLAAGVAPGVVSE